MKIKFPGNIFISKYSKYIIASDWFDTEAKFEREKAERKTTEGRFRSRIEELEVKQERNETEIEKLKCQLGNNENWLSNRW